MGKFIIKHTDRRKPQLVKRYNVTQNNKKRKNTKNMTTDERIALAQTVLNDAPITTKRIKKDKGLIERTESSKTILTEDNKELLID